jgi:uncharacterized phage protein gp47/JayE
MLEWGGKGFVMTDNPSWEELYAAAMLELDRVQLRSRIDAAQIAIRQSMEKLRNNCPLGGSEEMQALAAALGNLQSLQRVELRAPVSSSLRSRAPAEG